MRFETYIIAADADELYAVGESSNPLDEWSGIETPGLDTVKIATLHCLLTGDTLQTALELYEPVFLSSEETGILRIADAVLDRLAALDEEGLRAVAYELAATEDFEAEHWSVDDVLSRLTDISELAQLAESQGQALFARIVLLPD